jgi:hypothetical protein
MVKVFRDAVGIANYADTCICLIEPGRRVLQRMALVGPLASIEWGIYANLVWMISGFSCHSSLSTHIYKYVSKAVTAQVVQSFKTNLLEGT